MTIKTESFSATPTSKVAGQDIGGLEFIFRATSNMTANGDTPTFGIIAYKGGNPYEIFKDGMKGLSPKITDKLNRYIKRLKKNKI